MKLRIRGLVSVVIPCYNADKYIKLTIDSVLNQTHNDVELICIDDGSIDTSKDIITSINDSRISYFFKENSGVADTRNFGLKKAQGDYILFLDADDILSSTFLEDRINALNDNTFIACTSNVVEIDKYGNQIHKDKKLRNVSDIQELLTFSLDVVTCPSGYLFDKLFLEQNNILFNTNLQSSADKYFLLEVFQKGAIFFISDSPMYYRILDSSMSHKITDKLVLDHIAFRNLVKENFRKSLQIGDSYFSRLDYTIGASLYHLRSYSNMFKYLVLSLLSSPSTFFNLVRRNV